MVKTRSKTPAAADPTVRDGGVTDNTGGTVDPGAAAQDPTFYDGGVTDNTRPPCGPGGTADPGIAAHTNFPAAHFGEDDVSISSAASTVRRRRLRTQLEAAERKALMDKARIDKELIDLKLQLELEEASSRSSSRHSSQVPSFTDLREAIERGGIQKTEPITPPIDAPTTAPNASYPVDPTVPLADGAVNFNKFLSRQTTIKDLPQFSGEPEEWPLFYSQFTTTTRLCGYSEQENIARLTKCLKGRARDSVSALLISATNLDRIIDTLKLRFGRPEYLIDVMLTKIRAMRIIRHDDFNAIIELATAVQNVVATMKATDEVGHLTNPMLIREIVNKLPSSVKYQWSFHLISLKEKCVTLDNLSDWLLTVAHAAVAIAPLPSQQQTILRRFEREKKVVMNVTAEPERCGMCQEGNHSLEKCPVFKQATIDERWKFVTDSKLCFSCLSSKHQLKACKRKRQCTLCTRAHHKLLHAEPLSREVGGHPGTPLDVSITTVPTAPINHCADVNSRVLLKVLPVVVRGPKGDVETTALLDEGAALSLADSSLLERAGITGPTVPLSLRGARGMLSTVHDSKTVSMDIRARNGSDVFTLHDIRSVNNLSLPVHSVNFQKIVKKFPFLMNFLNDSDLQTYHDRPLLLLGSDNLDLIVSRRVYAGPNKCGPIVSDTKLGRVIHGKLTSTLTANDTDILHLMTPGTIADTTTPTDTDVYHLCPCTELNDLVKQTFSTDSFGVKPNLDTPRSREDIRALDILKDTTRYVEERNRWETGLLWRDDDPQLPDSYAVASKRLDGIEKKMKKMPNFAAQYNAKIQENLEKGYISKLADDAVAKKTGKTWYLPHFAVVNPNKPKIRIVLDFAAKSAGKSLNDFLLTGPDLLTSLPQVLLGFRVGRIAVMGDIQEMFHRVLIREEDLQAQRLLWGKDEYVMNVMTFGAVCSPASAQYVKNVNAQRFSDTHPEAVKAIVDHHYVDDFIYSFQSIDSAIRVVNDVINIHEAGGFNMRNFLSNSKELLQTITEDKLGPNGLNVLTDKDAQTERVLGVRWDPVTDNFVFQLNLTKVEDDIKSGKKRPTKRDVLKLIMSVFDPLGFLLYVIVKGRILFQDIWRSRIGWDDEIESSHFEKWKDWLAELHKVTCVRVPRWLMCSDDQHHLAELHVFCDASSRAFASVAYLRQTTRSNTWHVSFLMARARVAPVKILSVPRLELQAALMGARLAHRLKQCLDFLPSIKLTLWSDSKTVLAWLRSDTGRFKPFVAHRVSEIAELTNISDWRWLPSGLNVADDATRDIVVEENRRWLQGPEFLYQSEDAWPVDCTGDLTLDPNDVEVKVVTLLTTDANDALPSGSRFSSYWRLIRSTAWILRFIHNLRHIQHGKQTGELTAIEIKKAEQLWVKQSQRRYFSDEISSLQRNQYVQKTSSIRSLMPYLDSDGILRVGGRLQAATVEHEVKHPTILHPKDRFTRLLILQFHSDAGHVGRETVLNNLRQRFWILKARAAVKAAWNRCQACINRRAKPDPPVMGQLPDVRVKPDGRAFKYTGLDYFGPITVRVGRRHEKRYGALFTCLTVRAIHIEIVYDLTSSGVIMAMRRFISRRGCPAEVWSDNATTFRGADAELRRSVQALEGNELLRFASLKCFDWHFIAPNSPHMGGCWERLVRSVKTALKITLKERFPTDETLLTLMAETEMTVNSRPLTHVPIDHADDLPLTPNDFLLMKTDDYDAPFGQFTEGDLLRRNWRVAQRLADLMWQRWVKEYLPTLTRRDKWNRPTRPLAEGDIVVVADDQAPRNLWLRGVITKTYPGRDGIVRVVDVKTGQGLYRRPVARLCRLDVSALP